GHETWQETQNNLVEAKSAPPCKIISGIFTNVSTLLITVGFPNKPTFTGNGGLFRGSPRLPSIELNKAVSSPQMYAPAPRRNSTSKGKPDPRIFFPSIPCVRAALIAFSMRWPAMGYSPRI